VESITVGDRGEPVRDVHGRLLALGFHVESAEVQEHRYGPSTEQAVRELQQERGLLVDGLVGSDTWEELVEAGYSLGDRILYLRQPLFRGDDVRALQRRLNLLGFDPGREDGIFGDQTARAVREFQRNLGLHSDGIVGPTTLQELDRFLSAPARGPGRTSVRETETLRAAPVSLEGLKVALDPGHGPNNAGAVGPGGLREADVAFGLAGRLAEELRARGATPALLRARDEEPDPSERARRANGWNADVLVSIHLNSHDDPSAEGSSSYYFGSLGSSSVGGAALADLIQDEVTSATGLRDGRAHPKAFPILRETRMPAVQIEPCFITNPKEERLLTEEPFLRETARAVATGVERFFAGRASAASIGS
jgi:N-acetylmuramoyl-L-alanine amidase